MTDPHAIWQTQPEEDPMLVLEKLQRKMTRFHQETRQHNLRNYVAGPIGLAILGFAFYRLDNLMLRAGCALIVVAVIVVVFDMFRHPPNEAPLGLSLTDTVTFLKSELTSRRNLMRRVFWTMILLIGPGVPLLLAGQFAAISARGLDEARQDRIFGVYAIAVAFVAMGFWRAHRRAQRLQNEIDALPHVDGVST